MRIWLICGALVGVVGNVRADTASRQPSVTYTVSVDSARFDIVDVAMHIENGPTTFRLAMKVHPEYDAKYWRYIDSFRADGSANDREAGVVRLDSTLWKVTLPGGRGTVHYRVHIQNALGPIRRAWQPFMTRTGGLLNSPDVFLYLPEFIHAPVSVSLVTPLRWRVATALTPTSSPTRFTAPDAATLLDAPILVGDLREWSFPDRGTKFHVVYWPLPNAARFDTTAFIDEIRRLTTVTLHIFGRAPTRDFYFLLQDGANDALEHRASVTLGVTSSALALDPHASLTELAHEFFHTWNLVAIHPDTYGRVTYGASIPTTGLWWGEGVTIYYANILPRRAGLAPQNPSRLDRLAQLLMTYYSAPWSTHVSPIRASLAMGKSPASEPDATGGYYLQGELLANELDALLRDSTHDTRGLDDVMRALFAASAGGKGYTEARLEKVMDSVCGCQLDAVFARQVRGASLIDIEPTLTRLGLRVVTDTVPAVDSSGRSLPDLRIGTDFTQTSGPIRLLISNSASVWYRSGLRTGDALIAMNGTAVPTRDAMQRVLSTVQIGDSIPVDAQRGTRRVHALVRIDGYTRPRVRFVDLASVTMKQRSQRSAWLTGQ